MNSTLKKLSVILGMIFVAWVLILVVSINALFDDFYGWFGFACGVLTFILSITSMLLWKPDTMRDTTEINALPLVFTSIYFAVALIANTVFCFLVQRNYPKAIPVAVNALLIIIFVAARIFVLPYRNRVLHTEVRTAEKTQGIVELSAVLGEIIGTAQDETVKKRLSALKEQIDFSTNVSQPHTCEPENQFFEQLREISGALAQHMPSEDVLKKIDAAEITWKKRNVASPAK